jgi:hypothetical protein
MKMAPLFPDGETLREFLLAPWEDFLRGEGGWRYLRAPALLLLFAFCLAGGLLFVNLLSLAGSFSPPEGSVGGAEELARLAEAGRRISLAAGLRGRSVQTAQLAEVAGRDPMGGEASVSPSSQNVSAPALPPAVFVPPPEIPPPTLSVRAILIVGGSRTATMDIGDETARILREGETFRGDGGSGKVLKIDEKGVTVRWRKELIQVPLDQ